MSIRDRLLPIHLSCLCSIHDGTQRKASSVSSKDGCNAKGGLIDATMLLARFAIGDGSSDSATT